MKNKIKTKVVFDNGVMIMLIKAESNGSMYANGVTFFLDDTNTANNKYFKKYKKEIKNEWRIWG